MNKHEQVRSSLIESWARIQGVNIEEVPGTARAEATEIANELWNAKIAASILSPFFGVGLSWTSESASRLWPRINVTVIL